MKNALIAAASLAAIAAVVPAAAQAQDGAASNVGAYVNLGLAHADAGTPNYEIVGARLGYRFTPISAWKAKRPPACRATPSATSAARRAWM